MPTSKGTGASLNKGIVKKAICLCALLLGTAQILSAQSPVSAPTAERQAKAWLAAFDSGDRTTLLEFLKKNRPSAVEHIDDEMGFRAQAGGFELIKPEEAHRRDSRPY